MDNLIKDSVKNYPIFHYSHIVLDNPKIAQPEVHFQGKYLSCVAQKPCERNITENKEKERERESRVKGNIRTHDLKIT